MAEVTIDEAMRLAAQHHQAGRLQQAEQLVRLILTRQPNHSHAWNLLGVLAYAAGQNDLAIDLVRRAIAMDPTSAEFYSNLGNLLRAGGQNSQAMDAYLKAIAIDPQLVAVHNNLGSLFTEIGELDRAIACHQRAIELNPDLPQAHSNLGNALVDMGKVDQAIAAYRRAILLQPDFTDVHVNLAICLLLKGDYSAGWREYEWRWKADRDRGHLQNFWDGGEFNGKTVLLRCEQGFGDTLQFIRYLPMVAQRGGKIVVECQAELIPLLKQLPGVTQWIARGETLPSFDLWRPLLSLPIVFDTHLETIPPQSPALKAPTDRRKWLSDCASKFKVGLAWAGRPQHKNDRNRSLDPALLLLLAKVPKVQFVSLQKEGTQKAPADLHLLDVTAHLHDFADTAALIAELDLVVCVDTAIAHLAGVMGKPVWLLLPFAPDWRWLLNRSDSPWYPTMRLFRQTQIGDWVDVLNQVSAALTLIVQ